MASFRQLHLPLPQCPTAQCQGRGPSRLRLQVLGSLYRRAAYIVTNYHVVDGATEISVRVPSTGDSAQASIVLKDKVNDLAVLKVSKPIAPFSGELPFRLGQMSSVKVGQESFTLGFPLGDVMGETPRLATGTVSALFGLQDDPRLLQISNPIQPGNSGGPLFNNKGDLIGIVVSGLNAQFFYENAGIIPQNMNFAIKVSYLDNLLALLPEPLVQQDGVASKEATLERNVEVPDSSGG